VDQSDAMTADAHVRAFPGDEFSFRRVTADADPTGLETALDALDALRDGFEPLSVETRVQCANDATPQAGALQHPHWLLSRRIVPEGIPIQAMMRNPVRSEADVLSRDAVRAWASAALEHAQVQCGGEPEWTALRFNAARVRLGPIEWQAASTHVELTSETGMVRAPLERDALGTWISGPRAPALDQAPLAVNVYQGFGALTLRITVNYSLWLEEAEPAGRWLAEALARVEALGWEPA
jgi:hypothetical protein